MKQICATVKQQAVQCRPTFLSCFGDQHPYSETLFKRSDNINQSDSLRMMLIIGCLLKRGELNVCSSQAGFAVAFSFYPRIIEESIILGSTVAGLYV